jgi:hypothetical protein
MRSRNPVGTPRASPDTSRELARYFRRNGYVRWQNPKRLAREGYMGYKKGDEVRLTAQDEQELQYIHELLVQAGFRPGHPFVKGQQYRLPIYGREEVGRFLRLVAARGTAEPDSAANGSQPVRSLTNSTSSAAGSRR